MTFNFGETFNINGANGDKSGLTFFNDTFWINKPSTPTPGWKDVTVTGEDSLNLPNAKANGLNYLKAYGKCYQGNLPYGFTQLEYLESSGTQYLKLGVNDSNPNLEIETTFSDIGGSGYRYIVGCWSNDSYQNTVIYINSSAQIGAWVCHSYAGIAMVTADITEKHTVKVNKDAYYLDGNLVASLSPTGTERTGAELYAFKRNGADGTSPQATSITGKIHNISFKDNGVLIRNFIPARRNSDNELGMYDTVTDTFLTNAGTGTFTAGADLKPLPTYPLAITCNNGTIKVRSKSGLPDGYVKLKYLQSDGACYINLNRVPNNNDIIENKFQRLGTSTTTNSWYGSMPSSNQTTPRIGFGAYTNGLFWGLNTTTAFKTPADTDIHTIKFHAKTSTTADVTLDGVTTEKIFQGPTGTNYYTPSVQLTSYLFARHGTSGVQSYDGEGTRIFEHKESLNDGTLQLHVMPVLYTPTNTLGMYDLVSDTLLTNQGSGTLTSGGIDEDDIEIYIDGTTETIKDSLNNTATAENLLSAGTYKDVQSILDGTVTRNIGVKVLTGDETWTASSTANLYSFDGLNNYDSANFQDGVVFCTHFIGVLPTTSGADMPNYSLRAGGASGASAAVRRTIYIKYAGFSSVNDFKQWLADQFANGTPVILIYPLATATTETVTAQTLTTKRGDNTIEITQASLGDLTLEAEYQAGVTVTIEEVEEANLDNNVTVVIGE